MFKKIKHEKPALLYAHTKNRKLYTFIIYF